MNNSEIRLEAKKHDVFMYEIASELGVSEFTWIRHLRNPLPDDERAAALKAIKDIAARKVTVTE